MKASILKEKLQKGISLLTHIPGKNITLPILSGILISCEKNFLTLTVTDLEIAIRCWFLAKVEKAGSVVVPPTTFLSAVRATKNQSTTLLGDSQNLVIQEKGFKTIINGLSSEDFPVIPDVKKDVSINLPCTAFCGALSMVMDFSATSTSRPEISGIYVVFKDDFIEVVATDSFRLAEKKIILKNKNNSNKEYSFILPLKTAKEVINIFGEKKEGDTSNNEIKFFISENQVLFESLMDELDHPKVNLVSRLVDGDYPNYKEIIPQKYGTQIIINKEDFLGQIKLASLFCGKTSELKLNIDSNKKEVGIFSQSDGQGQHSSVLPCEVLGASKEVSFNCKFLLDGLLKIKSSEVLFGLTERNEDSGPGVLKPVGDDSYVYVLMPLRP